MYTCVCARVRVCISVCVSDSSIQGETGWIHCSAVIVRQLLGRTDSATQRAPFAPADPGLRLRTQHWGLYATTFH